MITIEVRGLLFDMDGILVSSLGSVERSWQKWGEMRDVDAGTAIKTAHGKRAVETIRLLRPDLDEAAELAVIEEIECNDIEDTIALEGVQSLLSKLPANRWTICTSATKRLARVRLEAAGITPPAEFISADMVQNGKPHPEPYLRGAQLLGFDPKDCLVIEDAPAGAEAGQAAGCHVLTTIFSHTPEQLPHADWIVSSLTNLQVTPTDNGLQISFEPISKA